MSLVLSVQAQNVFLLQGQVLNDTIERSSLNVVNVSLRKGAITNENGQFKIKARLSDTIHISAVQYESRQFVVNRKMIATQTTALYLVPKITELAEVRLSNSSLTGNLRADMLSFDTDNIYDTNRVHLPQNTAPKRTPEERRLYTSSTRGADQVGRYNARFDISLLAVINGLSGKTKQLKKYIAVSNFQSEVDRQRQRFSDTMYVNTFQIPLELIEDFVFHAMRDTEAVAKIELDSLIELFAYFEKKAKTYLVLKAREQEIAPNK